MTSVPRLSSQTAWCCWMIWMLVIIGQSMFADSKPIHRSINIVGCHNLSSNLVNVVTETLSKLQKDLVGTLNCSYEDVDIDGITKNENIIRACLPSMHSRSCICSNMNRTEVDEDKCLTAIRSDLKSYKNELQDLNPSINEIIKDMLQALNVSNEEPGDEKKTSCSSFPCKFKQCGTMLSFRLRTITISRILSYLKYEGLKQQKTWKH